MKLLGVAACVAALGCNKSNPNPSVAGTKILDWDLSKSERWEALSVKLKVHLETATVVFTEDAKQVTHTAPVKLSVTVVDAADFTIPEGKCSGPHDQLAVPGEVPREMLLQCRFKATKPRYARRVLDGRVR